MMKGRGWIWSLAMCLVLSSPHVRAEAEGERADVETAQASVPALSDPGESVEESINAYFLGPVGSELKARAARGEIYVGYATAEVKVGPTSPQWGKHRAAAYENALIEAENAFIRARGLKSQAEKLREYFSDTDRPVPNFQPEDLADGGKAERIVSKLLSVAEGRLDKELRELGVDEEDFRAAAPPQRQVLFREALNRTTTREALADLAGLMTMKTFEAHNSAGEHVIGVVVVQSPGLKEFAREIVSARGDIKADKSKAGPPIYEAIAAEPNLLVDEFGLRRLYDEEGFPVLISFGQSANAYTGEDSRKRRRYREAAKKVAEASADAGITFFVAGKANWTSKTSQDELLEEAVKVHPDGFRDQDDMIAAIETVRELSRARAKANLTGLTTVHSWSMAHPLYPDQEVVGVVRMYSPKSERMARQLDRPAKQTVAPSEVPRTGQTGVRSSKDRMDVHDF